MSTPESAREGQYGVDPVRLKVDEWLDGVQHTRDGLFDVFFIEGPNDGLIVVDRSNASVIEAQIREEFAERYPDLAIQESGEII